MLRWVTDQRMLVEYKPFEPAFYHTDIADWGMALELARRCGSEGEGAGGYGASSTRGRILSRLWRGCCIWERWAGSTSMIGSMRMMI